MLEFVCGMEQMMRTASSAAVMFSGGIRRECRSESFSVSGHGHAVSWFEMNPRDVRSNCASVRVSHSVEYACFEEITEGGGGAVKHGADDATSDDY